MDHKWKAWLEILAVLLPVIMLVVFFGLGMHDLIPRFQNPFDTLLKALGG